MQALQRKKSSWKNIYQILEIGVLYTEEKASNLEKKNKKIREKGRRKIVDFFSC